MEKATHGSHEPRDRATRWRGRVHQSGFVLSIPAGVALVLVASSSKAKVAATIYSSSLIGSYGASALYNRCLSTPRIRPWMRWLDHSMIYVLIAGSYTPLCLLIAPKLWGVLALTMIWTAALAGVIVKSTVLRKRNRLGMAWYLIMGWAALLILPVLLPRMSATAIWLLASGGMLYTAGAVVVYFRRPNPSETLFGYHEVWHTFVTAAGACHYAMQWLIVSVR
jgi:hemolysin III